LAQFGAIQLATLVTKSFNAERVVILTPHRSLVSPLASRIRFDHAKKCTETRTDRTDEAAVCPGASPIKWFSETDLSHHRRSNLRTTNCDLSGRPKNFREIFLQFRKNFSRRRKKFVEFLPAEITSGPSGDRLG
jgi:hypothetical protein